LGGGKLAFWKLMSEKPCPKLMKMGEKVNGFYTIALLLLSGGRCAYFPCLMSDQRQLMEH
jgi:hypothetical protein